MRQSTVLGVAMTLLLQSGASAAPIPESGPERTVACLAHLMLISDNLEKTDDGEEDTRQTIDLLALKIDVWLDDAESQPGYDADRMAADVAAFLQGPLGSGPDAISNDERLANLNVCVNEAPEPAAP
jgi:hypothetical protein